MNVTSYYIFCHKFSYQQYYMVLSMWFHPWLYIYKYHMHICAIFVSVPYVSTSRLLCSFCLKMLNGRANATPLAFFYVTHESQAYEYIHICIYM